MAVPKLAMIPSGYKAGKLYSILPTDGTGDFTVARNTTATRINSAGLIESVGVNVPRLDYPTIGGCPELLVEPQSTNLVLYSENFSNASWVILGTITITENSINSPSGTMTADLLLSADSTSFISQIISGTASTVYAYSFYIKNNNSIQSKLTTRNTITAVECSFNWSGSILSSITNLIGITNFKDVGNGWYRITSTYTSLEAIQRARVLPTTSANQSVYLWGAQLELGSVATSYIPTVAANVTRNADVITVTPPAGSTTITETVGGTDFVRTFATPYTVTNNRIQKITMI